MDGDPLNPSAEVEVVPGKWYAFRVRATNSFGTGPWGGAAWTQIPSVVPPAPTNIVLTPSSSTPNRANLKWKVLSGASPITSYTVQNCNDGSQCASENGKGWVDFQDFDGSPSASGVTVKVEKGRNYNHAFLANQIISIFKIIANKTV